MTATAPTIDRTTPSSAMSMVDIFVDPTSAFESIVARPRTLWPILVIGLLKTVSMYTFYSPSYRPDKMAITFLIGLLPALIAIGLVTLVLVAALALADRDPSLAVVGSLVAHTFLVYTALTLVWGVAEALLDVAPAAHGVPVYDNLAFLVESTDYTMARLLSAFDLLVGYHLVLIAVGLSSVVKRTSFTLAAAVVGGLWTVNIAIQVGIKLALT